MTMGSRVVIVGGGAGGTILANTLDPHKFDVTVVSDSLDHLFQPALLYVAFANAHPRAVRDESKLLKRHVQLVHDKVTLVTLAERAVTTATGQSLEYDYIVIASGMHPDPSQIPGLEDVNSRFGNYHSDIPQARKLWSSLDSFGGGTIALGQSSPIIKCPPSPLEGIFLTEELIAKRGLKDKTKLVLFTPYPRAYSAEPMNQVVQPLLEERGVEILTFFDVDRIDLDARKIYSIEGDEIEYDLPIVIPPFVGAEIAYEPAEVINTDRFVIVDKTTLRVKGFDNAFAIGDGTDLPTSKAGVGAHLEAKVVAATLAGHPATFAGRTHCPFDVGYGRGTFVIGSYDAPVVKYRPTRLKRFMKMMFERIYWMSLRGTLEPMFDAYFKLTAPKAAPKG